MSGVKIALVDDHLQFRSGIKEILSAFDQVQVVLEAGTGREFINRLAELPATEHPHIVFLDSRMPDMDGLATVRWIKTEQPDMRIIMFSMFDEASFVLQMLKVGVNGYISKTSDPSELYVAIKMVNEKGFYYSPFIAEKVIESMRNKQLQITKDDQTGEIKKINESLTKTEKIFLDHACKGLRLAEIAVKMGISPNTVEVHKTNVFKKMNVNTSVNMVVMALQYGLTELN